MRIGTTLDVKTTVTSQGYPLRKGLVRNQDGFSATAHHIKLGAFTQGLHRLCCPMSVGHASSLIGFKHTAMPLQRTLVGQCTEQHKIKKSAFILTTDATWCRIRCARMERMRGTARVSMWRSAKSWNMPILSVKAPTTTTQVALPQLQSTQQHVMVLLNASKTLMRTTVRSQCRTMFSLVSWSVRNAFLS